MAPKCNKGIGTADHAPIAVSHMHASHCLLPGQPIRLQFVFTLLDIKPADKAIAINTLVMRNLSSAQRAATVIKNDWQVCSWCLIHAWSCWSLIRYSN
jgi:hypothetical protein